MSDDTKLHEDLQRLGMWRQYLLSRTPTSEHDGVNQICDLAVGGLTNT